MTITVYKLKSTIVDPREALAKKTSLQPLPTADVYLQLWIEKPQKKAPQWAKFFENSFEDIAALKNSYSGAVLFVNTAEVENPRWFAVPFGTSWMRLRDEALDSEFGMQAALNLIDPIQLKTLDTKRIEDGQLQEKKSHSRRARVSDFEIDVDRILLSSISGAVKDKTFASSAVGGDSLKLGCPQSYTGIRDFCQELELRAVSDSYKADYPWFGKVARVKDPSTVDKLDEILVQELNKETPLGLYLAAPETLDESLIFGFKIYGAGSTKTILTMEFSEVHAQLRERFSDKLSSKDFQKLLFAARSNDGGKIKQWKLKKCILFEQELDGKHFLLSRGEWFEVNKDFKSEVEAKFNSIVAASKGFEVSLPTCSKKTDRQKRKGSEETYLSEGAYNERVCASKGFLHLDKKLIHAEGQHTQIEVCDFAILEDTTTLCHVKFQSKEYSSQTLSALFMQGYVSGVTLRESSNFRKKLNEKHGIFSETAVDTSKVHHKFVVVTDSTLGHIPFFSKISLSKTMSLLEGLGYGTSIQWVEILE